MRTLRAVRVHRIREPVGEERIKLNAQHFSSDATDMFLLELIIVDHGRALLDGGKQLHPASVGSGDVLKEAVAPCLERRRGAIEL